VKKFGIIQAILFVIIPFGLTLTFTINNIVIYFNDKLGINIEKGDITLIYIVLCVLSSSYGLRNDKALKVLEKNIERN